MIQIDIISFTKKDILQIGDNPVKPNGQCVALFPFTFLYSTISIWIENEKLNNNPQHIYFRGNIYYKI